MRGTTEARSVFPDDELSQVVHHLARTGLLEPHAHVGMHVSLSELMALNALTDVESMSQQDLADLLGLEKSTVSRLVVSLEARGWVTRERNPSNRRYYRLGLSGQGRSTAERIGQDLRSHHEQLLGALTPEERKALAFGLAGLVRAVQERDVYKVPEKHGGQAASW